MYYNINASENVNRMLRYASESAKAYNNGDIATEHLVYGILCLHDCFASKLLCGYGVDETTFEQVLFESKADELLPKEPELTPKSKQVFVMSQNLAKEIRSPQVDCEHILFCVLMNTECVAVNILDKVFNVNIIELKNSILEYLKKNVNQTTINTNQTTINANQGKKIEEKRTESVKEENGSHALDALGIDLTEKARKGKIDSVIGRKAEINRVIEILCRKTKNNPCLIGEAGVGKSAVAEGLALKIVKGDVPLELKDKIIFSFDISGLMAGTKFRGVLEQKLRNAITFIVESGKYIVFMDEIHSLMQTSSEKGEVSPVDILKPYLARGEFRTIGATTPEEYRKFIEKDKALERRFQPVTVLPPSKEDTLLILKGIRNSYEVFHGVKISDDALKSAIDLSDRYIPSRNFPDKAIDLIDEASSRARLFDNNIPQDILAIDKDVSRLQEQKKRAVALEDYESAIKYRDSIFNLMEQREKLANTYGLSKLNKVVGADDVAEIVSLWTKIPLTKLTETESQKLLDLDDILRKRVIGQDDAIYDVCRAVKRSRVGIKNNRRPIGSFLFLGPTGVGKTELSKAVAGALFDDENNLIRLDMSEYMESNSVSKLIGSPPGYVGYDEGGQLTERVRQKPYSVVLLDEIEKANDDVLNILLQLLDDGRLTDSQGRTVDFQNTIIIMTSNIGSTELPDELSKINGKTEKDEFVHEYLKSYLRPELINRIDDISVFASLNRESLAKIAKIMLNNLVERLNQRGIELRLTESALSYLIKKGYNKEFGARPLRRLIEQEIEDVIADDILKGELKDNYHLIIDEKDEKLIFDYREKTL